MEPGFMCASYVAIMACSIPVPIIVFFVSILVSLDSIVFLLVSTKRFAEDDSGVDVVKN
ncbi:hypothetical protein M422DRAFT_37199 [Sphaerobolus stellatus SS14]|uniref:Uncharacterized protein n=1 Tax=Sphaerobolus stellatus (strain SS14) TaxID=990650 RepID=A0A0C9UIX3_SPHS4|nr:hypothetical protein M422DRAFT_37199 [Sphaerobolus stellatus SS14]